VPYIDLDRLIERVINFIKSKGKTDTSTSSIESHLFDFFQTDHLIKEDTARAFLTKHIDWMYEQEYRCFYDIHKERITDHWIDGDEIRNIKSITFGTRFTVSEQDKCLMAETIKKETSDKNILLYLAEADYGNNMINRHLISIDEFIKLFCDIKK
jgi:hypothetical protein